MSIKINTNLESLKALRQVQESSSALGKASERLTSGMRINNASDDAAGLAIAESLKFGARVYTQGVRNLNDGISMLNIADGALQSLSTIVNRISELAEQAANGTYSAKQRSALNTEANALVAEYNRIIDSTKFNNNTIFQSQGSTVTFQGGIGRQGSLDVSIGNEIKTTTGDGEFSNLQTGTGVSFATQVEAADVNGDGKLDMIIGGLSGIGIKLGNGDGSFGSMTSYNGGTNMIAFTIADMNRDGVSDIITNSGGDDRVNVLMGNGNGTFAAKVTYATGNVSDGVGIRSDILSGDINGDGNIDIVSFGNLDDTINVFLGSASGALGARTIVTPTGNAPGSGILADFNDDGNLDIVFASDAGSGVSHEILLGNGDGTFQTGVTISNSPIDQISAGDFNEDGKLDLVTGAFGVGISVRIGNGNGTFGSAVNYSSGIGGTYTTLVNDFNSDGHKDIVASSGSAMVFFAGNGDGTFDTPTTSVAVTASTYDLAAGDYNGDNTLDLFGAVAVGGGATWTLQGNAQYTNHLAAVNLTTQATARTALDSINSARQRILSERSSIGASLSRIGSFTRTISSTVLNYMQAESRIIDADIASESANFISASIRQKVSTSMLQQANLIPDLVLKLLSN